MNKDDKSYMKNLREQAEKLLGNKSSEAGKQSNESEILNLLRELDAHRIELEMQRNEAQKLSQFQDALISAIPDIIMEVDANKVYSWANKAGIEFFGNNVIGKDASYYFEGKQDTYNVVEPLFKGYEDIYYVESWQRRKDGEKRLLAWWCHNLKDKNDKVIGALSTARDITDAHIEAEKLKESEERYRLLVDHSGIGVGLHSLDGEILYFNQKAALHLGGSPEDYVGKSLFEVFGEQAASVYMKRINEVAAGNSSKEFEDYVKLPTGENWFLSRYTAINEPDGTCIGVQILSHNITERKNTENRLHASEEKFRVLALLAPVGIYMTDEVGKCIYTNPKWNEIAGLSKEEAIGDNWAKNLHPDERDLIFSRWKETVDSGGIWDLEYRFQMPGGKVNWVHGLAVPQFDRQGNITNYIGVNINTTEQKEFLTNIKESEEKYRNLVELSPDAVVVHSGGIIQYVNNAAVVSMGGSSADDLVGRNALDFVHPDYKELALQRIKKIMGSNTKAELVHEKFVKLNGEVIDVETTAIPFTYHEKPAVQIIIRDISARKQLERKIKEDEVKYRMLADNMSDMVWLMDLELRTIFISPSVEKIRGYSLEEIKQLPLNKNIAPSSYQKSMQLFSKEMPKILSEHDYAYPNSLDVEFYKKDGTTVWMEVLFNIIRDEEGRPVSILSVGRDITAHKKLSEELNKSRTRLDMFFAQSLDGFFFMMLDEPVTWDDSTDKEKTMDHVFKNLRVTKINQAMLDQYGTSEDKMIGFTPADFFAHDIQQGRKVFLDIFNEGHGHTDTREKKTDGTDIIIEGDYHCFYDDKKRITGLFGIQRDVTEIRQSENILLENERQIRLITNQLPVLIAQVDREKRYKFVNEPYAKQFGLPVSEVIGKHASEILGNEAFKRAEPHMDQALSGRVTSYELELELEENKMQIFSVNYVPEKNQNNEIIGFIAAISDITEMKIATVKIKNQLGELQRWQVVTLDREDRNRELKEEINELLERLGEPPRYSSQKGNSHP